MTPRYMTAIVVAILALAMSPCVRAQEVAAPSLAVGDTWISVTRDIFTGLELSTQTAVVESADPQGYRLHVTGKNGDGTQELTLELNVKQKVDGLPSDSGQLNFPLKVGKKWRSRTWYQDRTNGVQDFEQEVVAIERQKVAAGEFETYKIVGKGSWIVVEDVAGVVSSDHQGRYEQVSWYAPAVKRVLIVEKRSFAKGHTGARTRTELERFELHRVPRLSILLVVGGGSQ
jgi:hypothetical protein